MRPVSGARGPDRPPVLFAGLHLLDRQLLDRQGRHAGKVDDLELATLPDGSLVVAGFRTGRGALARRLGAGRLADWLERRGPGTTAPPDAATPAHPVSGALTSFVAAGQVLERGPSIRVDLDREELATFAGERWVRRHVMAHLPGNRHEAV